MACSSDTSQPTTSIPPQQGDESVLYLEHGEHLIATVRRQVNTTAAVIDDACAFAWAQLLRYQPARETAFSWLATTAIREAIRLDRQARRFDPLDTGAGHLPGDAIAQPAAAVDLETSVDVADALGLLAALPERKRRICTLHVLGYSYAEIAELTGDTARTVDRQLARAKALLRDARQPAGVQ